MEGLNMCLSQLKSVKDGHVSKTRVSAVCEAALRALRHGKTAGEVAEALVLHAVSSSKEQRLAALYAVHETVWSEKRKLEDKNGQHRTEKRGSLSIALEGKIVEVMSLFRDASPKDRDQVTKILHKWTERFVFPAEVCRKAAIACDCPIPPEPTTTSPRKEAPTTGGGGGPVSSGGAPPVTILTTGSLQTVPLQIKPLVLSSESAPIPPPLPLPEAPNTQSASSSSQPAKTGGWGRFARGGGGSGAGEPAAPAATTSGSRGRSQEPRKRSRWDS